MKSTFNIVKSTFNVVKLRFNIVKLRFNVVKSTFYNVEFPSNKDLREYYFLNFETLRAGVKVEKIIGRNGKWITDNG